MFHSWQITHWNWKYTIEKPRFWNDFSIFPTASKIFFFNASLQQANLIHLLLDFTMSQTIQSLVSVTTSVSDFCPLLSVFLWKYNILLFDYLPDIFQILSSVVILWSSLFIFFLVNLHTFIRRTATGTTFVFIVVITFLSFS